MDKQNWLDKMGKTYQKRAEQLAIDLFGSPTWQDVDLVEKILVHGGMLMFENQWKERMSTVNKLNEALIMEGTFRA